MHAFDASPTRRRCSHRALALPHLSVCNCDDLWAAGVERIRCLQRLHNRCLRRPCYLGALHDLLLLVSRQLSDVVAARARWLEFSLIVEDTQRANVRGLTAISGANESAR